MNKLKYVGAGVAISLLLVGCADDKATPEEEGNVENSENASTEGKEDANKEAEENNKEDEESTSESSTSELTVDQETAELIEKDEGIETAIIQLETVGDKKFVNGHIKLNTMMKGEETAEKYADFLKEKYPGRTADMIITMDDKVLYQGTF